MSMSKKDFIALADSLRRVLPHKWLTDKWGAEATATDRLVSELMGFCQSRNPAFRGDLWYRYLRGLCGPSGGRIKASDN